MARLARFRRVSALLALLAAAVLVGACGGSDFRYLSNSEAGAFFKVPDSWSVYEEDDLLRSQDDAADREELEAISDRLWFRGFDGADDPDLGNVSNLAARSPRGFAQVRPLSASERDTIDLAFLRRSGFPVPDPETGQRVDPLEFFSENPDGFVQVLEYDDDRSLGELTLGDGLRGVRMLSRVEVEEGDPVVFEQVTAVDADTTRMYAFTVGCVESCWEDNEDVIREIADSWTLEETP
ncbi:MAG: hypothetical protein H0U89_07120 [Acidimicrobiia bacterium]|nr:hypothetical protein [Acidimicrobiia bacterium]